MKSFLITFFMCFVFCAVFLFFGGALLIENIWGSAAPASFSKGANARGPHVKMI